MAAPNYLGKISLVAEHHGGLSNHAILFRKMCECWGKLETDAKIHKYDILEDYYDLGPLSEMVTLLYAAPGADYVKDVTTIREKDREYGGSWYKRGGQGAFMMLARKWDRIEAAVAKHGTDIFTNDTREEGIRDDFGDLRRYLILVLAWHKAEADPTAEEDIPF